MVKHTKQRELELQIMCQAWDAEGTQVKLKIQKNQDGLKQMSTLCTQMAQMATQLQETQGQWSDELAGEIYSDMMRMVNMVDSHVQRVKSGQRELEHEYHDNLSMIDHDKQQKQV